MNTADAKARAMTLSQAMTLHNTAADLCAQARRALNAGDLSAAAALAGVLSSIDDQIEALVSESYDVLVAQLAELTWTQWVGPLVSAVHMAQVRAAPAVAA